MTNDIELMRKALLAHRAWHAAEEEIHRHLTTFNERMVLCNFAQWLTAKCFGHAEDYSGVPRLVVWPMVEIRRDEITEAEALVEKIMAAVEAAMTTPPATPWPGAVIGRVNQAALIEEEDRARRQFLAEFTNPALGEPYEPEKRVHRMCHPRLCGCGECM